LFAAAGMASSPYDRGADRNLNFNDVLMAGVTGAVTGYVGGKIGK
jgi:hypothetical protein